MRFRILGRHNDWVVGAKISESIAVGDEDVRRFTATIRGSRNWKIYQRRATEATLNYVISTVQAIRDKIDQGDEEVFYEENEYAEESDI